jgi:DNA mismatch repair ATPase MutL
VTLFKKYIRGSLAESSDKLKNPFIRLNIKCPSSSYDANIEPAKDNVIFENEKLILDLMESLLKDVYGECEVFPKIPTQHVLENKFDNFELLLARQPPNSLSTASSIAAKSIMLAPTSPITAQNTASKPPFVFNRAGSEVSEADEIDTLTDEHSSSQRTEWKFDRSVEYAREMEGHEKRGSAGQCDKSGNHATPLSREALNPWLIAKLNAPVFRGSAESNAIQQSNQKLVSHLECETEFNEQTTSATRPREMLCSEDIIALQTSAETIQHQNPKSPASYHRRLLDGVSITRNFEDDVLLGEEAQIQPVRRHDFITARQSLETSLMSPPSTSSAMSHRETESPRGPKRPFILPSRKEAYKTSEDSMAQGTIEPSCESSQSQNDVQSYSRSYLAPDLAWSMDYEKRKQEATRRHRQELRSAQQTEEQSECPVPGRFSPHKNRYHAAVASPEIVPPTRKNSIVQPKEPFKTTLSEDDPRAYLMRRNMSIIADPVNLGDPPKMMRAKSMKLPMERVRPHDGLHQLHLTVPTSMDSLKYFAKKLSKDDIYIGSGGELTGLAIKDSNIPLIAKRLETVVKSWIGHEAKESRNYEVVFTFGTLSGLKSAESVA